MRKKNAPAIVTDSELKKKQKAQRDTLEANPSNFHEFLSLIRSVILVVILQCLKLFAPQAVVFSWLIFGNGPSFLITITLTLTCRLIHFFFSPSLNFSFALQKIVCTQMNLFTRFMMSSAVGQQVTMHTRWIPFFAHSPFFPFTGDW